MYEYKPRGLGWAEPSGWDWVNVGGACDDYTASIEGVRGGGRTREVCFRKTPEDTRIANDSRCTKLPSRWSWISGSDEVSCEDGRGAIWCCPEGYPRPYMENIPSDVSIYEAERQRLLDQQVPVTPPTPEQPVPSTQPAGTPAPVAQHTFWTRLTHPGAIAAISLLAAGGAVAYLIIKQDARR